MQGLLRRLLPLFSVVLLGAALYDGWIFYGRWRWRLDAERARAAAEAQPARRAVAALGSGLQIRDFYATPAVIRPGQPATVCYSVTGASLLRLDPPVAPVYPAISHCIQAVLRRSTEFRLTAADPAGRAITAKLMLRVAPWGARVGAASSARGYAGLCQLAYRRCYLTSKIYR